MPCTCETKDQRRVKVGSHSANVGLHSKCEEYLEHISGSPLGTMDAGKRCRVICTIYQMGGDGSITEFNVDGETYQFSPPIAPSSHETVTIELRGRNCAAKSVGIVKVTFPGGGAATMTGFNVCVLGSHRRRIGAPSRPRR